MATDDLVRTADPAEVDRRVSQGYSIVRKRHLLVVDIDRTRLSIGAPPDGVAIGPLPEDPTALIEMHGLSYPPEHPDHVPAETDPGVARAFFADLFEGRDVGPWMPAASFAARRSDRIVGSVIVNWFDAPVDEPVGSGSYSGPWVSDLQVHLYERRHGLGRLLLLTAMDAVATDGHPRIGLAVTEGIPAEQLYRGLGFVDLAPPMWQLRPPLSSI